MSAIDPSREALATRLREVAYLLERGEVPFVLIAVGDAERSRLHCVVSVEDYVTAERLEGAWEELCEMNNCARLAADIRESEQGEQP